jgi:hypothetical protein
VEVSDRALANSGSVLYLAHRSFLGVFYPDPYSQRVAELQTQRRYSFNGPIPFSQLSSFSHRFRYLKWGATEAAGKNDLRYPETIPAQFERTRTVKDFEKAPTLDQVHSLGDFDSSSAIGVAQSTQRLLDDLLGRLEVDDSVTSITHALMSELNANSDE